MAIDAVARLAPVRAVSSIWETSPVGGPPQPQYLNAAIVIVWERPPLELIDELLRIELELGRVREVPNGPRTIDLDVLWADGLESADPRMVVPHPRLHERAFAVAPLLEVAPDAPYRVPSRGAADIARRPDLGPLSVGSAK